MDSQVIIEGHLVDLVDDEWRADNLPEDDIDVPAYELPDPEADSADVNLTLKEQEQKWPDISLASLSEMLKTKMEFPTIGKRCDDSDCKQLDFLPLQCKCGKTFCPEHFNRHAEICLTADSNFVTELKKIDNLHVCSYADCEKTNLVAIICPKCNQNFCVEHRHTVECEKIAPDVVQAFKDKNKSIKDQFDQAKSSIDKQIDENISKAKLKNKSSSTAQKVQLMRLKSKATGLKSIPADDRVYFNIKFPSSLGEKTSAVFVAKNWSVGRVIDAVANELKIPNKNNRMDSLKLRLFKSNGEIITTILSDRIEEIINGGAVVNGDDLIIEYVSDTCVFIDQ